MAGSARCSAVIWSPGRSADALSALFWVVMVKRSTRGGGSGWCGHGHEAGSGALIAAGLGVDRAPPACRRLLRQDRSARRTQAFHVCATTVAIIAIRPPRNTNGYRG